jgi:hypothetical protein
VSSGRTDREHFLRESYKDLWFVAVRLRTCERGKETWELGRRGTRSNGFSLCFKDSCFPFLSALLSKFALRQLPNMSASHEVHLVPSDLRVAQKPRQALRFALRAVLALRARGYDLGNRSRPQSVTCGYAQILLIQLNSKNLSCNYLANNSQNIRTFG